MLPVKDTDSRNLDILIAPELTTTLSRIGAIQHELSKLLSVPVDVQAPNALPNGFRVSVLAEARPA